MKLEDIGFYTLEDKRAEGADLYSPMWRCEMILTNKCNFKCPYCRGLRDDCKEDMPLDRAKFIIDIWAEDNLKNIRFSGGEPTCYKYLPELIKYCKIKNINRIAVSTNGSADIGYYKYLIDYGVNDFSISLDACCSSFGDKMAGNIKGAWNKVIANISELSKLTYVTVGMVFAEENFNIAKESIEFASSLGVSDIRIVSSAQLNKPIKRLNELSLKILDKHPILKYRVNHFLMGRNVRGIQGMDSHKCSLLLDDSVVAGKFHFPCIIHFRERGDPIGAISKDMRKEREIWLNNHNIFEDPICRKNCLDVCIDYNNKWREYAEMQRVLALQAQS